MALIDKLHNSKYTRWLLLVGMLISSSLSFYLGIHYQQSQLLQPTLSTVPTNAQSPAKEPKITTETAFSYPDLYTILDLPKHPNAVVVDVGEQTCSLDEEGITLKLEIPGTKNDTSKVTKFYQDEIEKLGFYDKEVYPGRFSSMKIRDDDIYFQSTEYITTKKYGYPSDKITVVIHFGRLSSLCSTILPELKHQYPCP